MFPQPFQVVLAPVKTPADRCPATKKSDCDTYQHFCQIVSFLSVASIIRDLPEIMNQFFCQKWFFSTFPEPPVFSPEVPAVPHSLLK
jgi:hypothetical protein